MACIKSVNRSASVALSPDEPYLATGTMAGAVDMSFSTTANMEIFKLDFQSQDQELPLLGQVSSSERFNRLSWSRRGALSDGLIAGGLIDGTIGLWNPATLIRPDDQNAAANPLIGQLTRHKGPVRGLEFNAITPNFLASGADDGEICIWDLNKPEEPSHYPPLRGTGSAAQGEISYLSWNTKVQHILASTSYNGATVVWDLKKQKPVINFSDPNRRRCSVLQWNPEVATQLFVASDDDNSPSLRLWDMRNVMSPVKEFTGHTKGVISMAWCPSDSSYLLTCAKDNRTICWDTITGEILCELPAGNNWNFDIHWYPKIPGVISASSFDGKIGLYNIEACSRYGVSDTDFGAASLRAPKWYKRPVGVSFGFGGKLVSFQSRTPAVGVSGGASEVFVHSLVTEDSLVSRSSDFEAAIHNGERPLLRLLCEKKFEESKSEDDRETWGFLKVMFEDDGSLRTKLLSHLGFSVPPEEAVETAQSDLSQQVDTLTLGDNGTEKTVHEVDKGQDMSNENLEDFFNNLSPKADTPVSSSVNNFSVEEVTGVEADQPEPDVVEETADPELDDAVQRALVVGDYKGAVAHCISASRMADALVIARVGGDTLWESTRDQYLKMSCSPYLKIVSAMVNHDLMSLVNTRPIKSWKETLALICTFAQGDEWTLLCGSLASKLLAAGNTLAATLCYICAGSIDKTVEIWSRCLSADAEGKSYVDRLQDLMEKMIVFALATGQKQFSSSLCKLVEKYAEILASQGQLSTALEYLKLLGEDLSPELAILKERIAVSSEPEKQEQSGIVYENSELHTPVYGADSSAYGVDASQPYYAPPDGSGQYGENNQPGLVSYGRSYTAATPYQSVSHSQPNLFVPSPAPILQSNLPSQTVNAQPTVRPFVPAPAPMLRNPEQYQQVQTLNSHLNAVTTGMTSSPYQPGPPGPVSMNSMPPQALSGAGQRLPQVVAPTPALRGFMPVTNPGVTAHRPGMVSTQPSSPTQVAPAQAAAAPAAPPPTIQTVDTSNVPAHQKPVIATLTRLFNETSEAVGGAPAKRREIDDNSRKLGALFAKLNNGDISRNAAEKLVQLCQALDNGDYGTASHIQVQLTTSEWDECNFWLATLKRMIKARQSVRL